MLYEIRSYLIDPANFEEYKKWSREIAAPYFRSKMDIVGAWFKNDMPHIYGGSQPRDENVAPPNMVWVIRWKDKETRDRVWKEESQTEEWNRVFSLVPGGVKTWFRTDAIFAEEY
jgi:hypothetical protein